VGLSEPSAVRRRGSLENNAKSVGNRDREDQAREGRWAARAAWGWQYSGLPRVRKCGRVTVTPDGSVGVRANGESVGYAGLLTCGSVWVCPVCNSRIQAMRRLEVGAAIAAVGGLGGGAAFGARTLRHHHGDSVAGLFPALSYAGQRIGQDKRVRALRAGMGYLGTIRAAEVTFGRHGPHPHQHPAELFRRPVTDAEVAELEAAEVRAWVRAVESRGLAAPVSDAQRLRRIDLGTNREAFADYFTKATWSPASAALEMTSSQTKNARAAGSLTPWQLMDRLAQLGDADDLDVLTDYEAGSKGRRALTFSPGLRAVLGIGAAATDEEVAAAEVGDVADEGFRVADWSRVARRPELGPRLLAAVGPEGNWQRGREFAAANGIPLIESEDEYREAS
jgi:hypothetical protein